ncbi:MAG: DUF2892 domain-containing protein [Phormidesmis sp. RL_2_1]|nr:DUF2892 domain-containing protein [Phormidesmis sp. RL_2_1]
MSSNVGTVDRFLRIIAGSVLLYLGSFVYAGSSVGLALDVVGAIALLTGIIGFCGLYKLLGINTRPTDSLS